MSFKELNLDSKLLQAVEASGYAAPTEIQRQAIPLVLARRDLMASAQTGTGKTAAFVLPALHRLLTPSAKHGKGARVLVLTPTRELAMQINDDIRKYGRYCRVSTGNVVGGMPYPPQTRLLQQPLDLLVATPGRLLDHMGSGRVDFSRLEILVLDEADRMLDMGFIHAIKTIAAATPASRQTLLFSATLEGKVLTTAQQLLRNPARIQLAANSVRHESIHQRVHRVDSAAHKHSLLGHYIDSNDLTQAVIFTATKRGADKLAKALAAKGHAAAPLHGNMNQNQRKRAVERMRDGAVRLLVATDVAARGLDIKGISHVINFDMPKVAEDYIHRIGRTGRAGATGVAISLVGPDDWSKLTGIERLTGRKLEHEVIPGLEPTTRERAAGAANRTPQRHSRSGNGAKPHAARHTPNNHRSKASNKNRWEPRRRDRAALG